MSKGLASVVVCTYNRANDLERCLQSLIMQSYTNLEIIVVNGPSTDQTPHILAQYPMVRVIDQKGLTGLSVARNLGIQSAKGEIVAFIDDDAVAEEHWVEKLIRGYSDELIGGVGGLVLYSDRKRVQFDNGVINKSGIPTVVRPKEHRKKEKKEISIIMGTNCSFRKDVLYKIGGFDPYFKYYHDESDLCVRLHLNGYRIVFVRDAVVFHEMSYGHNRCSTSGVNWTEIVKNSMYFSLKNFGNEVPSYTIRPIYSLLWWFIVIHYHFICDNKSLKDLLNDYQKVLNGAIKGYGDGVRFNLHKPRQYESFLVSDSPDMP